METRRERKEKRLPNGITVVEGVAPEKATKLTPERRFSNMRSLRQSWETEKKEQDG